MHLRIISMLLLCFSIGCGASEIEQEIAALEVDEANKIEEIIVFKSQEEQFLQDLENIVKKEQIDSIQSVYETYHRELKILNLEIWYLIAVGSVAPVIIIQLLKRIKLIQ